MLWRWRRSRVGDETLQPEPLPPQSAPEPLAPEPPTLPEPIEPTIDLAHARKLIDDGLVALAGMNHELARANFDEAGKFLPARHVPTHLHIFDTYYAADLGKPYDEADMLVSEHQFARHLLLLNQNEVGPLIGQYALAASTFMVWYDNYVERARADPGRITPYGYRSFSVSNDDGLIDEIFRRIGTTSRHFVEFGMHDGIQSNSTALLFQGWSGLRIEASRPYFVLGNQNFRQFIASGKLRTLHRFLTAENIEKLLAAEAATVKGDIDLLSIDVDGNDYWIWCAVETVRPRAVIVEYNANIHPPVSIVQPYDPLNVYSGTSYFGASLDALARLGERKGYKLVGCSLVGDNAFFVRDDLVQDKFHAPGSAAAHYEPARPVNFPLSNMPGFGRWEIVE